LEREFFFSNLPVHRKTTIQDMNSHSDNDFFANIAVEAMQLVKNINPRGEIKYPVRAVNILKAHGKSATESMLIKGYALNCTVASQGIVTSYRSMLFLITVLEIAMKKRITNAKIACLDMNLQKQRMHLGVHITIDDPDQLEAIRKRCVSIIILTSSSFSSIKFQENLK
jgi:T-complex protein 1 subunit alpha